MNALWDLLFGSTQYGHGQGCGCATCYGIAAQERAAEQYFSHSVSDIPAQIITEKEVKGERVDNQVKRLEKNT